MFCLVFACLLVVLAKDITIHLPLADHLPEHEPRIMALPPPPPLGGPRHPRLDDRWSPERRDSISSWVAPGDGHPHPLVGTPPPLVPSAQQCGWCYLFLVREKHTVWVFVSSRLGSKQWGGSNRRDWQWPNGSAAGGRFFCRRFEPRSGAHAGGAADGTRLARMRTADRKKCSRLRYHSTMGCCGGYVHPHCLEPSDYKLLHHTLGYAT